MYCPSCGSEERQLSQFCRACGTDLRAVRTNLERPDAITASAISAREQIGMVVAEKIRQMESARDLETIAEDVLPSFEKFLESPEEKRLRRIRAGVITAAIGFGLTVPAILLSLDKTDFFPFLAPGFITFLVGLGMVINGLIFTLPKKQLPGQTQDRLSQGFLDSSLPRMEYEAPAVKAGTNELAAGSQLSSVTEHTTHHLNTKQH